MCDRRGITIANGIVGSVSEGGQRDDGQFDPLARAGRFVRHAARRQLLLAVSADGRIRQQRRLDDTNAIDAFVSTKPAGQNNDPEYGGHFGRRPSVKGGAAFRQNRWKYMLQRVGLCRLDWINIASAQRVLVNSDARANSCTALLCNQPMETLNVAII